MPDTRRHRGPHPQDVDWFAAAVHATLQQAAGDLSWLLEHGYATRSSLKLVGDRFALLDRQRRAVLRSSCSDHARNDRATRRVPIEKMSDQSVTIDGFNLLTTIEAALAGGVLLLGRDGALRDMASMHGSYRKVQQTRPALERIGAFCDRAGIARCCWLLDQPVSNSGRLRTIMLELAAEQGWNWTVELLPDPDAQLCRTDEIVISADAMVLDGCHHWYNLAAEIVAAEVPDAWLVDFRNA